MGMLGFYKEMRRICEGLRKRERGLPDPERLTVRALKDGTVNGNELSLRRLYEATVHRGREALDMLDYRRKGGMFRVSEMQGGFVDSSVFSKITGQFLYDRVLASYKRPAAIWPKLVTEEETRFVRGEKEPRWSDIGDEFGANIDEGEAYGDVGFGEEWVEYPAPQKFGKKIALTQEVLVEDRAGEIYKRAGEIGKWMDVQKDKRVITTVTGSTGGNTYKYKDDTAISVYQASTPYINSHSNTLVDYTDIENAMLLFDAMTDPAVGEFISVDTPDLLVPSALRATAWRVKNAMQVWHVDNQTNATTYRTAAGNPIGPVYPVGEIISSPYVKSITTSASTWFLGDFKAAFVWKYWQKLLVEEAPTSSWTMWARDLVAGWKVKEAGVCGVREPRYATKNT